MKKAVSLFISAALLILIAFVLALIIFVWGKDTVTIFLSESYENYRNNAQAVAGAILRVFGR